MQTTQQRWELILKIRRILFLYMVQFSKLVNSIVISYRPVHNNYCIHSYRFSNTCKIVFVFTIVNVTTNFWTLTEGVRNTAQVYVCGMLFELPVELVGLQHKIVRWIILKLEKSFYFVKEASWHIHKRFTFKGWSIFQKTEKASLSAPLYASTKYKITLI